MFRIIIGLMTMSAVLLGCQRTQGNGDGAVLPNDVVRSSHVDSATGNRIALWMVRNTGQQKGERMPVLADCPYAVFIYWPSEEYQPNAAAKRVFIFYDNVTKTCYQTRNYESFLKLVAAQPRGITLLQIETCSVPRDYRPALEREQLERVMAEGNRTWGTSVSGDRCARFCYCESTGQFIYPADVR